jgi:tripartite-type tricarboxylate transporter receptor subunit TctC
VLLFFAAVPESDAQPAFAQNYPVRPVRIVVPSSPGGTSDILARILAHKLVEALGQQVVIDNRAGAGGTIGYEHVAKSAPDGHTLLIAPASITINPSIYSKLPYNALRDFAPISLLAAATNVLCVHPSIPATSVKALIALARSKPGTLVAGSAGIGTSPHLSIELFKSMAGIDLVIVHYKGSGQGMIAMLSGENAFSMPTLPTVSPHLKAGRMRPLGVTAAKRSPLLPEVPTIAEAGYPGGEFNFWVAMLAPRKTPRDIVGKLNGEINRALNTPEMKDRLAKLGGEPMTMSPEQFDVFIRQEHDVLGKVMRDAGVKAQ